MKALLLVLLLALAAPAAAQEQPLFQFNPATQRGFRIASDVLLDVQIARETWRNARSENRWHALGCEGLRLGAAVAVSETAKRLVGRMRPDGSDRYSFPSEHTMLAFAAGGWRASYTVAIGSGVAVGRMGARRHYLSDVLAGAFGGTLTLFVCGGE